MKPFLVRTLSGAAFVAIVVSAIFLSQWVVMALFGIFAIIGLYEFYINLKHKGIAVQLISGIIAGSLIYAGISLNRLLLLSFIIPILFILFVIELYRKKENPFNNIAFTILGIVYIAVPFGLINLLPGLKSNQYEPILILSIFIITWANDTFAYLVGVGIGKHRLFERHSPKKSWEGFWGGIVFSVGTAGLLYYLSPCGLKLVDWIAFALIISIAGTLGDLTESMFKRSLNIKDSGFIMPGHGGILDRFDSILFSVPFIFCYLIISTL